MRLLSRFYFLLFCMACYLSISFVDQRAEAAEQPNVVIYLSDDHSYFDTGLYGAEDIATPEMERLAADGMSFTHAFVASPACAPSRGAMLTGLMPARNGAEPNHSEPRQEVPLLIQNLQQFGYEVAAFGKVAHGKHANKCGFDHLGKTKKLDMMSREVRTYLQQRKSQQPLCLFVGTSNPHVPWSAPTQIDPASVKFPPHHLDTPETRRHRAAYYQEIQDLDVFLGTLRKMTNRQLGKNTLFIHTSDHGSQWPFGKWNLYDYGIRVPFLAAWPGVIEPGTTSDAMISWVDLLPTVLDLVGPDVPAGVDGRSFAAVLRGGEPEHRQRIFTTHTGDGNMNIYPIRSVRTKDWKLIWNLHPEFAHTNHSDLLRKPFAGGYWNEWAQLAKTNPESQKILDRYYKRPEFELYHVSEDPWELDNLANDPVQAERLQSLKRELEDWMARQGDTRLVHEEPRKLSDPERWHPDLFQIEITK